MLKRIFNLLGYIPKDEAEIYARQYASHSVAPGKPIEPGDELIFAHRVMRRYDHSISEIQSKLLKAEKAAHELIEQTRYTLESAALVLQEKNTNAAEQLHCISRCLPYILSGRRHWEECPGDAVVSIDARRAVEKLANDCGFELPKDSVEAVKCLLELSSLLLVPAYSLPVDGLRVRYPVNRESV